MLACTVCLSAACLFVILDFSGLLFIVYGILFCVVCCWLEFVLDVFFVWLVDLCLIYLIVCLS